MPFISFYSPANITVGRLGALLAYAYHLCKHYIKMNAKVNLVVTFLGIITTWLFKFLIKAKFYEWLESMGGWVSTCLMQVPLYIHMYTHMFVWSVRGPVCMYIVLLSCTWRICFERAEKGLLHVSFLCCFTA